MLAYMLLCFVMNGHIQGLLLEAHVKRENPQVFILSKVLQMVQILNDVSIRNYSPFLFLKRIKIVENLQDLCFLI